MKAVRELLRDRRRTQRGSVLSGVLIIVAFLSIVIGAVMTELSTSFLMSRSLVNRVVTQATVDSAIESSFNQLQNTPLGAVCPAPLTVRLNGQTAVATYLRCFPTVDSRTPPFTIVASSTATFTTDGTHVVLPRVSRDEFLIGDGNATVYEYDFGQSTPGWTARLEGSLTGPPTAMVDVTSSPNSILDLVPVTDTSAACGTNCVSVLHEQPGSNPQPQCFMQAAGAVTGRAAAGLNFPSLAFFGDATGTLWGYAPGEEDNCSLVASNGQLNQPIVDGPIVFAGPTGKKATDEIYVLASDGNSSQLVHYTYSQLKFPTLRYDGVLALPAPEVTGFAVDQSTVPARIAITFLDGQVAVAQVATDFSMSLPASATIPTSIARAPFWCHCPGGDVIGVGGRTGLYLLDTSLNVYGTYAVTGTSVKTAPTADGAGDWFFGADDGYVYEVQRHSGQTAMTLATRFGNLGAKVGSSATLGSCPAGLCIYLAARNGKAFLIPLDARDAVLSACITTAPPSCSGINPRLWANVEVGAMGSPQTVHVTGWSYYSP